MRKEVDAACLNCGGPLTGPFCSECGQRDLPPYPTLRELTAEAIAEFSGWDGRFLSSIRTLITKPGVLTLEFLQGRRVSYISPLRLYLFASVAYFLVAAWAPSVKVPGQTKDGSLRLQVTGDSLAASRPQRVAEAAREAIEDPDKLTAAQRDSALRDLEGAPAIMRPMLRGLVADPKGYKQKIVQTLPKMLFVLLPVFALIVSLFYRKRRYPEHLYFAIHLHTFVFVALTIIALSKFAGERALAILIPVSAAALLSIPVYSTIAFRRVYGGSIPSTLAKEAGIGILYSLLSFAALIGMLYWVSIF